MKKKFLKLTWPQRVMMLLQAFLVILFLILYAALGQQKIMKYRDTTFCYHPEGETVVYSGKVNGQKAIFTISPGPVVEYRLGDTLYGPYTMVDDPTAIPQENEMAEYLHGLEIRKAGQVWFRGAYFVTDTHDFWLFEEDGTNETVTIVYGEPDPEPSPRSILTLALFPKIIQRGHWGFFWMGILCCIFSAVSILFADKLFRWNLRFIIRNPEGAEPSDWELFSRWVGWSALTIVALVCFIMGLNGHFS